MIEIVNCSTELNAFLSFLRTCEESNRLAILTENDMDRQTQDILHNIELNENSQYDYICQGFTLRDIRRKRRKAKDIKEATAPICSWMKENRKVISDLERLLGDVRKQEKQAQNRSYTNRTGVMKKAEVTPYNHDPYHSSRGGDCDRNQIYSQIYHRRRAIQDRSASKSAGNEGTGTEN